MLASAATSTSGSSSAGGSASTAAMQLGRDRERAGAPAPIPAATAAAAPAAAAATEPEHRGDGDEGASTVAVAVRVVAAPEVGRDPTGLDELLDRVGLGVFAGPREQRPVAPRGGHELLVRAVLDRVAVLHHDDPLGEAQRGTAVRDQDRGAVLHDLAQRRVDLLLGARVDRRRRVVEDENARIGEHRARDRDALPLAAGEREAAFADHRVVAVGEQPR